MKKLLFLLVTAAVCLSHCRKADNQKPVDPELSKQQKYPVTFNMSALSVSYSKNQVTKLAAVDPAVAQDSLTGKINILHYLLFNSAGDQIQTIQQDSTISSFGTIKDSLPAGTYTAFFIGSKSRKLTLPYKITGETLSHLILYHPYTATPELFFKKVQFTVGSAVDQNVSLGRLVGKFELTLRDTLPAGVTQINVVLDNETTSYDLNLERASINEPMSYSHTVTDSERAQSLITFSGFVLNTQSPQTITVRAVAPNLVFAERSISGVMFYRNRIASIHGSLFGTTGTAGSNTGFQISVNGSWDEDKTDVPL